MPRHEYYCQCSLYRDDPETEETWWTTTYLPADKLKKNAKVRFRNKRSEPWSPWWTINRVGRKHRGEYVEERETDYQRTRQASDV